MRQILSAFLVCAFWSAGLSAAEIDLQMGAKSARVTVPAGQVKWAQATAEWLDENDKVVAEARLERTAGGAAVAEWGAGLERFEESARRDVVWHRLRLRWEGGELIRSFSTLHSNFYRLQLSWPRLSSEVVHQRLLVRAVHPVSEEPVAGVQLRAALEQEDGRAAQMGLAVTDADGFAVFRLSPPKRATHELRVVVRGELRGNEVEQSLDLEWDPGRVYLSTDRLLYQPGQPVKVRALAFDELRKARGGAEMVLRLTGERSEPLFETKVKTTRFGVASAEWTLPESMALGRYTVQARMEESEQQVQETIQVSRYELPTFRVEAVAERGFYLVGERPVVRVRAVYATGKPVVGGRVAFSYPSTDCGSRYGEKAARNPHQAEAVLDAKGGVSLQLEAQPGCPVDVAVTVTDPVSLRSEAAQVTMRVVAEALTVEAIRLDPISSQLPVSFLIRTKTADGVAVSCGVELYEGRRGDSEGRVVGRVRTNADGLARIDDLRLGLGEDRLLRLVAQGPGGMKGEGELALDEDDEAGLRLRTDRWVYRPGESVRVRVEGLGAAAQVMVVVNERLVEWRNVQFRQGRAELVLPYREEYRGVLQVLAQGRPQVLGHNTLEPVLPKAGRRIFFTEASTLHVQVEPDSATYRPGQEALLRVKVTDVAGRGVAAALGLSGLDEAFEQRARQRQAVDREGEDPLGWLRELSDSDRLTPALQLKAGAALEEGRDSRLVYFPWMSESLRMGGLYEATLGARLRPFALALERCEMEGSCPTAHGGLAPYFTAHGLAADGPVDPWGKRFSLELKCRAARCEMEATSAGPDGEFQTLDDSTLRMGNWSYFAHPAARLRAALAKGRFPQNEAELSESMRSAGLDERLLEDQWGHRLKTQFLSQGVASRALAGRPDEATRQLQIPVIALHSAGPDGVFSSGDDFEMARLLGLEESELEGAAGEPPAHGDGGLAGEVQDASKAVIPGAKLRISGAGLAQALEARTDEAGRFEVKGLPPGSYLLTIESPGFVMYVHHAVVVPAGRVAVLPAVTLQLGTVSEIVAVMADAPVFQTETASMAMVMNPGMKRVSAPPPPPASADGRVREKFPETLLWMPLVETDAEGSAEVRFQMADSLTGWHLRAVGSTMDGRLGLGEKSVRTYLPFFLEFDPPQVLTSGDEIELPVTVRNYTKRAGTVSLALRADARLALPEGGARTLEVGAGEAETGRFTLKAGLAVEQGRLEAAARGAAGADTVRRSLRVVPYGRRVVRLRNELIQGSQRLAMDWAEDAAAAGASARLRLFPDLASVVLRSPESMLKRPYGCGEQTISSTYPNLLVLRLALGGGKVSAESKKKALANLEQGLRRLLSYRASGGFTYFHGGAPDVALSAYALDFLREARAFVAVDAGLMREVAGWVASKAGGETAAVRAFAGRALAEYVLAGGEAVAFQTGATPEDDNHARAQQVLQLRARGRAEEARTAAAELMNRSVESGPGLYWKAPPRTPFHGWGQAGEVETTALVLRALLEARPEGAMTAIEGGVRYLLGVADEHGLWYSTQASVRVLDVLLRLGGSGGAMRATLNGRALEGPEVELGPLLRTGANELVLERPGEGFALAQLVTTAYESWEQGPERRAGLDLEVSYSNVQPRAGEEVQCTVKVRRENSRSTGMLIAEAGLPPGADVDLASLDRALKSSGPLSRYEILPDRVVLYLWPHGADVHELSFPFRPRFGMRAWTAPSVLYDYYNPAERTEAAPVRFEVSGR